MIRVGIVKGEKAFLPEVSAYLRYLGRSPGINAIAYDSVSEADDNSDVIIVFMGVLPFWRAPKSKLISEYHSLSVGFDGRIKDLLKRLINAKGDYYIFLNERVRRGFFFSSRVPHVLRSMGYDSELVEKYKGLQKEFDFVYSGTYSRPGVRAAIEKIAAMGFSVAVVGAESNAAPPEGLGLDGVRYFGKVSLDESYSIMARARFGLNFTPNEHPYYFQDSTKVIEYCGLGLGVVTNRYQWVNQFERAVNAKFASINELQTRDDVELFPFSSGDVSSYSWDSVIRKSNLAQTIVQLVEG